MGNQSDESGGSRVLYFRERFASSQQFGKLFKDGMSLVEETAHYLDGEGRAEARLLVPPASLAFSTESMTLTTRLMQIASWLLIRRAVANGEINSEEARTHKRRVRLAPQSQTKPAGFEELPRKLRRLIADSHRLHDRITRLDRLMDGQAVENAGEVELGGQIARIHRAFPAA